MGPSPLCFIPLGGEGFSFTHTYATLPSASIEESKVKLIQAMKLEKDLQKKAEDLRQKVSAYCADLSFETPVYGTDQQKVVDGWIQSHHDILKEIESLRYRVQKTNISTPVTIELGGKQITKSISEWIWRRRDLAKAEMQMWSMLTDRNLKEGSLPATTPNGTPVEARIRRYYSPATRDEMKELFRSEPSAIDSTLEVVNAVTDLVD